MARSITDITEQHLLRERFRLAVGASPAALLMVDQAGIRLRANSRSLTLFGYEDAELLVKLMDAYVSTPISQTERFHAVEQFPPVCLGSAGSKWERCSEYISATAIG